MPFLLIACASEPKETVTDKEIPAQETPIELKLELGQITHDIPCGNGQTYDLYLPKNYDSGKNWSVLIAFDPQGDGTLPLENYRDLANEFGIIMAGSNFSKNGVDINLIKQHYQNLKKDIQSRVSSNDARFYMLGFSGGAKVATQLGLSDESVVGIIACGAATKFQKPQKHLLYSAIAGKGDFNYPGMFYSYRIMVEMGVPYVFQTFEGKHEWAPDANVAKALRWFALDGMKTGAISKDEAKIQEWKRIDENEIGTIDADNTLEFYTAYGNMVKMYDGLVDVSSFKDATARMETSGRVDKAIKDFDNLLKSEEGKKAYYMKALNSQPFSWWKDEVKKLNTDQSKTRGEAKYDIQRTIGFLGLAVYMQASSAVDKNMNQEAGKLVSIYLLLEPKNPEAHYLNAVLSARTGDKNGALAALKEAKMYGFTNAERLQTQPEFEDLRGMDGYSGLFK